MRVCKNSIAWGTIAASQRLTWENSKPFTIHPQDPKAKQINVLCGIMFQKP